MMNSNLHANRGGLTPGAFGGHERLDKCDLTGPSTLGEHVYDVVSNAEGERTLWVRVILFNTHRVFQRIRRDLSRSIVWQHDSSARFWPEVSVAALRPFSMPQRIPLSGVPSWNLTVAWHTNPQEKKWNCSPPPLPAIRSIPTSLKPIAEESG